MYVLCVVEAVQTNPQLFTEHNHHARRTSEASILSTVSGIGDTLPIQAINKCKLFKNSMIIFYNKIVICSDKKMVGY